MDAAYELFSDHVRHHQGEKINKPALKAMSQQIIANNRAGGWRKLTTKARP